MSIISTLRHLPQYRDFMVLLLKYGDPKLVSSLDTRGLLDQDIVLDEKDRKKAEELPDELERLGATYVKLGQFLSTRSDLLPAPYVDALARLQDNVEPFSFAEIETIVQEELGVRLSKAFAEFDAQPMAAASLGQVHRAVMRDGRFVAVKVQRPGIRQRIMEDLEAFQEIATLIDEHSELGHRFMVKTTFQEFRTALIRELDYRREAQNLIRLGDNMREFENIIVPDPIEDYTTSRVLTMDYIKGKKITDINPIRSLEFDANALADEALRAYLKQILVDGFYHADPHPGNVFITSDNKIALIDLGMVAHIARELRPELLRLLLAVSEGDGSDTTEALSNVGHIEAHFNKDELRSQVTSFIAEYQGASLEEIQTGRMVLELTAIAGKNGLRMPNEFVMIGKVLMNLDKVGLSLSKNFRPGDTIRRYAGEMIQRQRVQDLSLTSFYHTFVESKNFMEHLPERANRILQALADNQFTVRADVVDEQYLMVGFQKIANRLTVGLVIAAMIIGAALMMDVSTRFTIFGYPGIAMLFFLLAGIAGIILVYRVMFYDEETKKKKE